MSCLVRRIDRSVAYITKENVSRSRCNTGTPRPLPEYSIVKQSRMALCRINKDLTETNLDDPLVSEIVRIRKGDNTDLAMKSIKVQNAIHKLVPNLEPLLVRQPSRPKSSTKVLSIGEKRNISKQELNIILNSLKEIRSNIRYTKLNTSEGRSKNIVYKKQLEELNAKLC